MFDLELLLTQLTAQFKTALNTAITAINTEKGAPTLMSTLDTNAWLIGSLDDKVKNYDNFVFGYVDDLNGLTNGQSVGKTYTIEYDLFISQKEDGSDYTRMLRYWRALEQAGRASWDVGVKKGYDRATINLLNPIDIKLNDSSYWHKVIGIKFEFTIVN